MYKRINGEYDEEFHSIFGGSSEHYKFQIDKINPGFYLAINPGLKIFLHSKYFLDISMGWDMCFNKLTGTLTSGNLNLEPPEPIKTEPFSKTKTLSCFHMNVGFGF